LVLVGAGMATTEAEVPRGMSDEATADGDEAL